MTIDANYTMHFQTLNDLVRKDGKKTVIKNCCGQRYIAAGMSGRHITVNGTPGNALGAYNNGCTIVVNGNAQDAVGDTMNSGTIIIHGNAGDAPGYAMRGGRIFVRGGAGYRAGIHMKQYKDKKPVMIIGEQVGSFLGEYLAGGLIAVLNLSGKQPIVGNFTGTGMHGGRIFLRTEKQPDNLPVQVSAELAGDKDMKELLPELREYCKVFGLDFDKLSKDTYYVLKPNAKNPYKKMYTHN